MRIEMGLGSRIVSLTFAVGGIVMAICHVDGWGWAFLLSVISQQTVRLGSSDGEVKGDVDDED